MKILLIQNDYQIAEGRKSRLENWRSRMEVTIISTEHEFHLFLENDLKTFFPDIVISDIRLPWAFPDLNPPKKPFEGDFRNAGVRCLDRFRKISSKTTTVPWIFLTFLDKETVCSRMEEMDYTFDSWTGYVYEGNPERDLFHEIKRLHITTRR